MNQSHLYFLSAMIILMLGCNRPSEPIDTNASLQPKGSLFIIGGGKRPPEMIQEMIDLAGINDSDYVVVLPMSSSEPDTAFYYARKQFMERGVGDVVNFNFQKGDPHSGSRLDSLVHAKLIYISGGDQTRFMEAVAGTSCYEALHEAYQQGAVIAGTSAGAAVMSKKMITGNEFKHPEYTGEFRTIESDNMELLEGMGFLQKAIIDQHFIRRMRMNRLMAVAIENPGFTCIGIDESTAIVVQGDSARVTGNSQVIVLISNQPGHSDPNGLLSAQRLELAVYVPGNVFRLD